MSSNEVNLADRFPALAQNFDISVNSEDRMLVRNIVATLITIHPRNIFHALEIHRFAKGYHIIAKLVDTCDFAISQADLHTVESVSPSRINGCFFERKSNVLQIRINVLNADQPVCLSNTFVTHIQKRRRFMA